MFKHLCAPASNLPGVFSILFSVVGFRIGPSSIITILLMTQSHHKVCIPFSYFIRYYCSACSNVLLARTKFDNYFRTWYFFLPHFSLASHVLLYWNIQKRFSLWYKVSLNWLTWFIISIYTYSCFPHPRTILLQPYILLQVLPNLSPLIHGHSSRKSQPHSSLCFSPHCSLAVLPTGLGSTRPTCPKASLLTLGCGEGKYSVYCRVPSNAHKTQTPWWLLGKGF